MQFRVFIHVLFLCFRACVLLSFSPLQHTLCYSERLAVGDWRLYGLMPHFLRIVLIWSLCLFFWSPTDILPSTSSPERSSLGFVPSSIFMKRPIHLSSFLEMLLSLLAEFVLQRISQCVILSLTRIRSKKRTLKKLKAG